MRMITLVVAGLLALPFSAGESWAAGAPGVEKKVEKAGSKSGKGQVPPRPAPKGATAKPDAKAKTATSHLGSKARQELLGKRMEQLKKGGPGKKDTVQAKSKKRVKS